MIPAGEVLAGTLVFLECGCSGTKAVSPPDGPVLVIVMRPCADHIKDGKPQLKYLQVWELVSPLTRTTA